MLKFAIVGNLARLEAFRVGLADIAGRGVDAWTAKVLADAQARAPVLTGRMRDSGYTQPAHGGPGVIGFSAYYAGFVNDGHHTRSGSFVPANPFLTGAVEAAKDDLPALVGAQIEREV